MVAKNLKTGVFIDHSNLFNQVLRGKGYPLDLREIKTFLGLRIPFPIKFCNLYGCIGDRNAEKQREYYNIAREAGIKPIIKQIEVVGEKVVGDMDYEIKEDIKKCFYDPEIVCIALFSGDKHFIPELTDWLNTGKYVEIFSFKSSKSKKITKQLINKFPKAHYTRLNAVEIRRELEYKKA